MAFRAAAGRTARSLRALATNSTFAPAQAPKPQYVQSNVCVGVLLLSVGAGLTGAVAIDQALGPVDHAATDRGAPARSRHFRDAEARAAARRDARAQKYYEDYARSEQPRTTQQQEQRDGGDAGVAGKRPLLELMGEVKQVVRWAQRFIGRIVWAD